MNPIFHVSELELELIQTQMAQKPMLRAEVYAHAMRASQNRKKEDIPCSILIRHLLILIQDSEMEKGIRNQPDIPIR